MRGSGALNFNALSCGNSAILIYVFRGSRGILFY